MNLNFWKKDNDQVEASEGEYQYSNNTQEGSTSSDEVVQSPEYYKPEPADPEKARFYNNISKWALYVAVFLMPLFFLPWTSNILNANKQLLLILSASVALISWLLGIVSSGNLSWRNNKMDKGVLVLLGAFVLGTVFSIARFKSVFGFNMDPANALISVICFTLFYFLVVNNTDDGGKTLKSLAGISLVLALLYGLLQIFGIYTLGFLSFAGSRGFNTVGSVNVLGLLAAIALPLFSKSEFELFGMGWVKKTHIEKIGIVLSLVLLVILNWWVLWTVAIGGMVAMIVFENLGGGRFKIKKLILPMTVVVLGVFMMVVNLDLSALKKNLPVEVAPSFSLSVSVIKSVLKENLIFGYGPGNFSIAFDKYGAGRLANTSISDAKFASATSNAMTLVAEGGLVMALALLFFLVLIVLLFKNFRSYAVQNQAVPSLMEDVGTLASFAAVLVAMFLYPFNMTLTFLMYLFMGLSVLVIYSDKKKDFNIEEKPSLSLGSSLGFIGGLILVLVGIYFGMTTYVGDVKYAQALAVKDNNTQASLLVDSINWNNSDDIYYRTASQTALKLLADQLKQKASAERDARIQNYVTTAISLAKKATDIQPREATNWANLGFIYQNLLTVVNGVDKLSEDAYMKAGELRPGDPAFNYQIGILYLTKFDIYDQLVAARQINPNAVAQDAKNSLAKAETNLQQATQYAPNFGLAIYNLGVVYEREGKLNQAINQLEKVAPANSNQPGLAFELGLLYYRAGRKDDAFNALQRAVALSSDYANARWYLGLIYEERGDIPGAIDQMQRILSIDVNKNNTLVQNELTKLQAGKPSIPPQKVLDQQPIQ